jgi:hypothetical protein
MLATLVLMTLPMMAWDGPDPASPEALFAQFRNNTKAFHTLKLQWRREANRTPEWIAQEKTAIQDLEAKAAALDNTTDDYHELNQEIHRRNQAFPQLLGARRMVQAYRTDRVRFRVCTAPVNWNAINAGPDWSLPDEPVTEESMKTTFNNFSFVAYAGDPNGGFMTGMPMGGGFLSAQVRRLNSFGDRNLFPPLGVEKAEWGVPDLWHPIDAFFRDGPAEFSTVGRETIDGHEVVVIERRAEPSPQKGQATNRRVFIITRAWLDPKRGALPMRITWSYLEEIDGKPSPATLLAKNPWQVLETTEILEVKNAGFYPSKGTIKQYGPMSTGAAPTKSATLVPFSIVEETTTWEVAKIEANEPITGPFTIPIPKGTYYYDEVLGYQVRAGYELKNQTKLPWSLCGVIIGGWAVYGLVAVSLRRSRRRASVPN